VANLKSTRTVGDWYTFLNNEDSIGIPLEISSLVPTSSVCQLNPHSAIVRTLACLALNL